MAPKKKAGSGSKGKKKGDTGPGIPLDDEERNLDLENQRLFLEKEFQQREVEAQEALAIELQFRENVEEMEKNLQEERKTTYAVTADMARQYKSLQEELIHRINSLESTLTEQKDELDLVNRDMQEFIAEQDEQIAMRDALLAQLNARMEDMTNEFADMLSGALDLIKTSLNSKVLQTPDPAEEGSARVTRAQLLESQFTRKLKDCALGMQQICAGAAATPNGPIAAFEGSPGSPRCTA